MRALKNIIRMTRVNNPSLLLEDLRTLVQQATPNYTVSYADLAAVLKSDTPPLYVRQGTSGKGGANDAYRMTVWYKHQRFVVTRWDIDGVQRLGIFEYKSEAMTLAQTSGLPQADDDHLWPSPEEFFV